MDEPGVVQRGETLRDDDEHARGLGRADGAAHREHRREVGGLAGPAPDLEHPVGAHVGADDRHEPGVAHAAEQTDAGHQRVARGGVGGDGDLEDGRVGHGPIEHRRPARPPRSSTGPGQSATRRPSRAATRAASSTSAVRTASCGSTGAGVSPRSHGPSAR
ncbi:hypothetical protein L600_004400000080 [Isoptericola variabilis J7]|nr:hypothetical protein L600_004400000080 [Isoptericola variabilis J7]